MTVRQKSMFEAEMSMTIKNIRREDLGSYICVAKNSLGDVESKIRLYGKNAKISLLHLLHNILLFLKQ